MYRSILFFVFLCFCLNAKAQISDSLYKALPDTLRPKNKRTLTDQERIKLILNASHAFLVDYYTDFKTMTYQLEKNIDTVKAKTEKIPYANAIAVFYMGVDERANFFLWEQKLAQFGEGATKYRTYICYAYNNMAMYYSAQGKQDSAIVLLHKGLTIANRGDAAENLPHTLYSGYIQLYRQLRLYYPALEYIDKYLNTTPAKEQWNDDYTEVMMAKANVFANLFRIENQQVYADSAKKIIQQIMQAKKAEAAYWYFLCYFYLGYLEYYQQNYHKAILYFELALSPVHQESQGYRFYLPKLYKAAAQIALGHSEGVGSLLGLGIPAKDFNGHQESSKALYEYYRQHKDYQKALDHYQQYKAWVDSSDVLGQNGKVFEAEQKYSVSQKEAAIAQLENRNLQTQAARNKIIITAIIVVLLLAILALLLYLRNKRQQTQRLSERQQLTDELHAMEQEMELDRVQQQNEKELAMDSQRKTISQNMHDEVSTSVALLPMLIADEKQKTKNPETKQVLARIEEEARNIYLQVREFMHQLHSNRTNQNYNVVELLDNLSIRFGIGSGLQVLVEADRNQIAAHFTPQQHAEMYRLIKEAVTNSMKHSGASQLQIRLYTQHDAFYFDIEDDGRGLVGGSDKGLGLLGLRERLAVLQGQVQVSSSGKGLHISGYFPMDIKSVDA